MPAAGLLATLMPGALLSVSVSVTEIWVCRISPFCNWAVATSEVAMWTKMRSSLAGGPQKFGLRSTWTNWSVSYLTNVNGPLPTVGFWKNGCCSSWVGSTAPRMCSGRIWKPRKLMLGTKPALGVSKSMRKVLSSTMTRPGGESILPSRKSW